jgi:hypothetical protein
MRLFILEIPITAVSLIQCIIEKPLMEKPICELGLCTRKVRIRLSAFVASYFLPNNRNLPWHQMTTATGASSRIFEKTRKFSTTNEELLSVV